MSITYTRMPRSFWYSAALGLLFNGCFFAWLVIKPGTYNQFVTGDNLGQTLCFFLGFLLCIGSIERPWWRRPGTFVSDSGYVNRARQYWIPLLVGLGLFGQFMGQAVTTYYVKYNVPQPSLSWADVSYLSAYPFLLAGILLLPSKPLSSKMRVRLVLDSLMIMTAVITFSWYFILGPTFLQGNEPIFSKLVGSLYPFGDLVLALCLLLTILHANEPALRPTIYLLSFALPIIILADSIYDYQTLKGPYSYGLLDLAWPISNILIGLAVQALRHTQIRSEFLVRTPGDKRRYYFHKVLADRLLLWQPFLPYAFVPTVMVLVVYVWWVSRNGVLEGGVYIGEAILIGLVLLRQVFSLQEMNRQNNELRRIRCELQENNQALNEANTRFEALATSDPLTGLPNHRALCEHLNKEIERAHRFDRPLSIVFFDGDRFKQVNDTYGHAIGDGVLRELGERVRSVLRDNDILGRYGGEEFMALLPETETEQARLVAERMRAAVAALPLGTLQLEAGINVTISIGIATYPRDGHTDSELLEQADHAMYWAKRLGRNQVRTVAEAQRASRDPALAATIHSLERRSESLMDGISTEQKLRADQLGIIYSLMWLLELRDHGISSHAYEVSDIATAIAQEMHLDQEMIFAVSTGSLLHDIGKIAVPDAILQKEGLLTKHERTIIQQHPEMGAQILEVSPVLRELMPAIRSHHEYWDGSGYPDQLVGANIPLEARIIAVAEAYTDMLTEHPYRQARSVSEALQELQRCAGTQFDPTIIQAMTEILMRQQKVGETRALAS